MASHDQVLETERKDVRLFDVSIRAIHTAQETSNALIRVSFVGHSGLSKQMVKQRHGDTQFKAWRRGYSTRPPEVSSFSPHYPGNDRRYLKYLSDIRFSVRESVIRSIEKGQPSLHRKLPKAESLKDCMDRTIPFYKERIYPEALQQGKRVLISSSENAIRGLLMHLCNIPVEMITELEIVSLSLVHCRMAASRFRGLSHSTRTVTHSQMVCLSYMTSSRNALSCSMMDLVTPFNDITLERLLAICFDRVRMRMVLQTKNVTFDTVESIPL